MASLADESAFATLGQDPAGFERWLVVKSFSLLAAICRTGILIVAFILLVLDPLIYGPRWWEADAQQLTVWRVCAAAYFLLFLLASGYGVSHPARSRILLAFFVAGAALFCWLGVLSWTRSGDLSTYAIFLLTMACVFSYPGHARSAIHIAATTVLAVCMAWFDGVADVDVGATGTNLVALTIASLLIDRHLMAMNRALYVEQRRSEYERERADRVLYSALPESIANELKNSPTVRAQRLPLKKIKTIGDAYMVVGKGALAPIAELALDMVQAVAIYSQRSGLALQTRSGIDVGPAVAGVIGRSCLHYDVWGDAVNTASRMESTGASTKVQVSEAVFQELRDRFIFEARGECLVKGKGPLHTYFLLGHQPR
ncbi:MAG: hypothetical protein EBY24_02215 [Betaproteobacteria bacterium]|nr:hypothetical protein [Betaproteobacteria bacterium]